MFLGLRTVICPALDLDASKAWWTALLGFAPHFDEPFYVGFSVAGYELGLVPARAPGAGPVTYWGVANCVKAHERLLDAGTISREPDGPHLLGLAADSLAG